MQSSFHSCGVFIAGRERHTCDIVKEVGNFSRFTGSGSLEFGISMANLLRAHGGCLGVERLKGVEVCEKPGGVDKQVMIPGFPTAAS